ncbi:cryptochrome/photolyase family protein [Cellulomonas denverensis]|uniref:Deoxyribodipyrimidine photo-lyase n=1 Tax=Cellulomonas denverensis TaxID=264297 RepID=A0A7X6KXR0_9CELL|nr:deoxyribodipyrimidine photo-lyase [Cellulomonas denverensis]NKY24119.1 deoxyribodipyrimidine photo-lyase [Cellulomonas denverensis]GIG25295.1 deoxyribodipyrimidine photo-lyase [Cellulomonas denverensis]
MTTLHWFRRDLRLGDNPALMAAADQGDVLPVFVLDPALWHSAGDPRRAYLLRSLRALDEQLDGGLLIRRGDPCTVIPDLAREVAAEAVHITADSAPAGRRRDEQVERALDVPLVGTGSPYAVTPGRVRTKGGDGYQVFTPFRRAWQDHGWHSPAPGRHAARERLRLVDACRSDPLPEAEPPAGMQLPEAGEVAALDRWAAVLDGPLAHYDTERDRPDLDGTSRLSVPLKWGEVHPRTLLADLARHRSAGADTFRGQLAWRDFHADVLFHSPSARDTSLTPVLPEDSWAEGAEEDAALTAWAEGRTGYPLVDAGMRQLRGEGWMHNRVRMVVASFLVKDLHVRWQRGAAHFMTWLVDGDVPQNQLNWQWVAGTGRDAAPYFRVFNPVRQGLTYDPEGRYVRRWVPELRDIPGRAVHEPWKLPRSAAPDYPAPVVDHSTERAATLAAYQEQRRR